jgi:hypothetical protein
MRGWWVVGGDVVQEVGAGGVAARAYALNHQNKQARAPLTVADALMNRLPAYERSNTWLTDGEQKHHLHLRHTFTTLGDTCRAFESQQRVLELSAPISDPTPSGPGHTSEPSKTEKPRSRSLPMRLSPLDVSDVEVAPHRCRWPGAGVPSRRSCPPRSGSRTG